MLSAIFMLEFGFVWEKPIFYHLTSEYKCKQRTITRVITILAFYSLEFIYILPYLKDFGNSQLEFETVELY